MNIYQPATKRAVRWFANWVAATMPTISADDAMQDLWIEVMKAAPRYDASTTHAFSTFIGKHLRWRAINLVNAESRRLRYTAAYVYGKPNSCIQDEQPMESLIEQARKCLDPFDKKVFDILIDPPPGMISESKFGKDYVTSWRLASYLDVPRRQVEYTKKKIRKVVKQLSSTAAGSV